MTSAQEEGFTRTYNYGASDSPTSIQAALTGAAGSQLRREEFSYGPGGLLQTRVNDQAPSYPVADRLGTLTGEVSDRGEASTLPELDPFGVLVNEAAALAQIDQQTLGFLGGAGRESLPDSDLVRMGARMYDAETGAFVTRDPVTGGPSEPARRVPYAYAFSGPGRYVDLDGESVLNDAWNITRDAANSVAQPIVEWSVKKSLDPNASTLTKILASVPGVLASVVASENLADSLMAVLPGPGKLKALGKAGGLAVGVAKGVATGKNAVRGVDEILSGLSPGKQAFVRTVGSDKELRSIYDELASAGKRVEVPGYPGKWVERPDGIRVGIRETSKSGGATIDIRRPDGAVQKVHIR